MYVLLLLIGGLLFGTAAFAGSRAYELAGIAVALWLVVRFAVVGGRRAWRVRRASGER